MPHFTSYVHFKTLIGFALRVSRTEGYSFKSGTSFVELAVNRRISIYNEERQTFSHYQCIFLPLTASSTKMSQLWMNSLLSWIQAVQTLWGFQNVHSWWNVAKSETIFWKECMITEQWKRVMQHNQTHTIVHSSAMYYQKLIIIHECSKQVFKDEK